MDVPVHAKHHRVLPQTSQHCTELGVGTAQSQVSNWCRSKEQFRRAHGPGFVATEGGLGSDSCLGNSSSPLPAVHRASAFPSVKAGSQSQAGARHESKITCTAQSPCQQICWPTAISSSLPHILPFRHCHGRAGMQPTSAERHRRYGRQSLVASRDPHPQDHGPQGHGVAVKPGVPQPKGGSDASPREFRTEVRV